MERNSKAAPRFNKHPSVLLESLHRKASCDRIGVGMWAGNHWLFAEIGVAL